MNCRTIILASLLAMFSGFANACPEFDGSTPSLNSLTFSDASFNVSATDYGPKITSFATIKNASNMCFQDVVIEIKYYDANNTLIDTVTGAAYGAVVPAMGQVAVRIRDDAARPKQTYSTQVLRLVSALPRYPSAAPEQKPTFLQEMLITWLPLLMAAGAVIWMVHALSRRGSVLRKWFPMFDIVEDQYRLQVEEKALLERIANAVETKNEGAISKDR